MKQKRGQKGILGEADMLKKLQLLEMPEAIPMKSHQQRCLNITQRTMIAIDMLILVGKGWGGSSILKV